MYIYTLEVPRIFIGKQFCKTENKTLKFSAEVNVAFNSIVFVNDRIKS